MKLANRNTLIGAGVLSVLMLATNPAKDAYLDVVLTDQEIVTRSAQYLCTSSRSMFFSKIEDCPPATVQDKAAIKQFLDSRSYRSNFILASTYTTKIDEFRLGGYQANPKTYYNMGVLGNFTGERGFYSGVIFFYIILGSGTVIFGVSLIKMLIKTIRSNEIS